MKKACSNILTFFIGIQTPISQQSALITLWFGEGSTVCMRTAEIAPGFTGGERRGWRGRWETDCIPMVRH